MRASGLGYLVADDRSFPEWVANGYPVGDSKDYLSNLMCGTEASTFHHVLVQFSGGLSSFTPLGLFGRVYRDNLSGSSSGTNAYVAEVKLLVDLSGVATV